MAQDIVPVQLGLTEGDVVTLWAPRWREDGEEWEAFLGHGENLYVFDDAAQMAAFVRTATEHDLIDHPAWRIVPELTVDELTPDQTQRYDLVGVPELVANDPDTWAVGDLADVLVMVRSLAEVCDLDVVREVLDSADGFTLVNQGAVVFTGRDGERLWTELATVVAERWDEVIDAIDAVVATPEVDEDALAAAQQEQSAMAEADADADTDAEAEEATAGEARADVGDEDDGGFWAQVGIDPIRIVSSLGEHYTLRCYLDDEPIFLGTDGKITVTKSTRALAKHIAQHGSTDNDLAEVSTWDEVATKATDGTLEVEVETDNTYVLNGLADDIGDGVDAVDPVQLDLAVELLRDAADWADDKSVSEALAQSESLGWLVSFVTRPDPTRMAPSPPFEADAARWRELVDDLEKRLVRR